MCSSYIYILYALHHIFKIHFREGGIEDMDVVRKRVKTLQIEIYKKWFGTFPKNNENLNITIEPQKNPSSIPATMTSFFFPSSIKSTKNMFFKYSDKKLINLIKWLYVTHTWRYRRWYGRKEGYYISCGYREEIK